MNYNQIIILKSIPDQIEYEVITSNLLKYKYFEPQILTDFKKEYNETGIQIIPLIFDAGNLELLAKFINNPNSLNPIEIMIMKPLFDYLNIDHGIPEFKFDTTKQLFDYINEIEIWQYYNDPNLFKIVVNWISELKIWDQDITPDVFNYLPKMSDQLATALFRKAIKKYYSEINSYIKSIWFVLYNTRMKNPQIPFDTKLESMSKSKLIHLNRFDTKFYYLNYPYLDIDHEYELKSYLEYMYLLSLIKPLDSEFREFELLTSRITNTVKSLLYVFLDYSKFSELAGSIKFVRH